MYKYIKDAAISSIPPRIKSKSDFLMGFVSGVNDQLDDRLNDDQDNSQHSENHLLIVDQENYLNQSYALKLIPDLKKPKTAYIDTTSPEFKFGFSKGSTLNLSQQIDSCDREVTV
jgi:hypothetical protein